MNWITKSSHQLEHKLPLLPYHDRWVSLSAKVRAFRTSHSGCIALVFLLLLSAWAASNWFLTVQTLVRYYNPLPMWDYWDIVRHLPKYRALDLSVLWQQHNEHRIVFPEIVFALDMLLAHGLQILPLALSFLCYFCTWLVMSWAIFSDKSLPSRVRYAAILLSGAVVGWQGSTMALGIPFLLQWTLTQFASVLAFVLLQRFKHSARYIYLIGTIASATVATYSSGNGMLLWPLIVTAGLLLAVERPYILALITAGIANIGLYFVSYHLRNRMDLTNLLSHPVYLVSFLSSYVCMPFGILGRPQIGIWMGLANLLLFLALLAIAARTRLLASAPSIVLFGYFAFTLLTALLTAAGRMDPQDSTFTAAKASRYVTLPQVNWGALAMALMWLSAKRGWRVASPMNIAFSAALLLFVTFPKLKPVLAWDDVIFARQQWATLGVENGLFDPDVGQYIHPVLPYVKPLLRQLRDNHLSIFFKGYTGWLGQPVTTRLSGPFIGRATGAVTRTLPIEGGVEVIGWAEGSRSQRLVFVNDSGRIAGFGRKLLAGFPYELRSPETPTSLGWVGFVNLSFETKSFRTYLIDRRTGRITPLGTPSAMPMTRAVAPQDTGASIAGIEWQMDRTWTVNGVPRKAQLGTSPPNPFYGSWSGTDRNTGQITSSEFSAPANGCIVLPVLHGTSVNGLSVEIVDADTNRVLEAAPMQDVDIHWRFWRFLVTPDAKRLRINAEDQGQDSGQWLAVGQPSECR